ncbi:hypothetical protein EMCRGX_G027463 [Ephydatia muelleri]
MSHLYYTVEPGVISEALLHQCVQEQGPEGEAGRIARSEGIDFREVNTLRLDFKNILRIEHLWQFRNLRRLQLDNNIIECIDGLDQLVNLEWLDLSFNNIEDISGLNALVNLRDLSLAHNRIAKIQNLEGLTKLQTLSIAGNIIAELENVAYLRQFACLQCLVLKENPLAEDQRYPHYVIAYIPSLIYLDFRLVQEDTRLSAHAMFQEMMEELALVEREKERKSVEYTAAQQKEKTLKEAYVDGLAGMALFDAMFEEDKDAQCFRLMPEVPVLLESYATKFAVVCEELKDIGLRELQRRNEERAIYQASHEETCTANQKASVRKVQEFEEIKQKLLGSASSSPSEVVKQLEDVINGLHHDLMQLEMLLVEQIEEGAKDFERNYSEQVSTFLEHVQAHMTRLRDLENTYHETVSEKAQMILEKFIKNQLDIELPDELRVLMVDKDTLVGALNAAHDCHLLAIDNKEDSIVSRAKKDRDSLIETIQNSELKRNRQKIVEIEQYIEQQKGEEDEIDQQN